MSEFNDSDNDTIEITAVHGTQAVSTGQDFVDICIEVENTDTNDSKDNKDAIASNNILLQYNILSIPVIYTTRIDEMNCFNKIDNYTPKEAALVIESESKPKYKHTLSIKREPCEGDINLHHKYSYMKLCSYIERLNFRAAKHKLVTTLRNKLLKDMCKPLKIVLTDIYYDSSKLRKKEKVNKRAIEINHDDSDSSEDMPLKDLKVAAVVNARIIRGSITLAFIDKISKDMSDIYVLNKTKELQCFYRTSIEKFNSSKTQVTANTVVNAPCCWVRRELQTKELIQKGKVEAKIASFMRKPHGCLPGPCRCCCTFKTQMRTQTSTVSLNLSSFANKTSKTSTEASKLIQKACSLTPNVSSSKLYAVDEPMIFLKSVVIIIKYSKIIFPQCNALGENYEIGREGDIENHEKVFVNRSLAEERELFEKHDNEDGLLRKYFSYLICCWCKREEILVKLHTCHKLSLRALSYLRKPHSCKSNFCQCCLFCKLVNIRSPIENVNENAVQSKKEKQRSVRSRKKKDHDYTEIGQASKKVCTTKFHKAPDVAPENITTDKCAINKTQYKSVSISTPESIQGINLTNNTLATNTTQQNVTKTLGVQIQTEPANLIASIMDRFKDLKLSVNENGKLIANITTHPDKLTAPEIKVLADILVLAATQIDQLGITPEEFCRRVNSKSVFASSSLQNPNNVPVLLKERLTTNPLTSKESGYNLKQIQPKNICKTEPINTTFPAAKNTGKKANLYSKMSNTSAQRNKYLAFAYKIHFNIKDITDAEDVNYYQSEPKSKYKRNNQRNTKPELKVRESKLRIVKPEELVATDSVSSATLMKAKPVLEHSQSNNISLNLNDQFKKSLPNAGFNLGPIIPEGETKNIANANQSLPLLEPLATLRGKIWACINGKLVQLQKAEGFDTSKRAMATNLQQPVPTITKPELVVRESKLRKVPPEGLGALDSVNSATLIKAKPVLDHSQAMQFTTNRSLNLNVQCNKPLPNVGVLGPINSEAKTINIANANQSLHFLDPKATLSGKIWACIDGKLVQLQTADGFNASKRKMATNLQQSVPQNPNSIGSLMPILTVSNGVSMQTVNCTGLKVDDVNAPTTKITEPKDSGEVLSSPYQLDEATKTRKRVVAPIILKNSKTQSNKRRRVSSSVSKDLSNDVIESPIAITPNTSLNEVVHILDTDDEEEESIFGM